MPNAVAAARVPAHAGSDASTPHIETITRRRMPLSPLIEAIAVAADLIAVPVTIVPASASAFARLLDLAAGHTIPRLDCLLSIWMSAWSASKSHAGVVHCSPCLDGPCAER